MKLIAISAFARAGKDTLGKLLKDLLEKDGKRVIIESFAKPLRAEMYETINNVFNLDVYTQDSREKEIIRPLMVDWAAIRRNKSNGNYFADKLQERLNLIKDDYDYCIVTDFRFAEYWAPENNNDELGLVKRNNGFIIHIKQYSIYEGHRVYLKAPNSTEKKNDPLIQKHANYHLSWPKTDNQRLLEQYALDVYKQVIK